MIGIDEVQPDGLVADQDLARRRRRDVDQLRFEDLWTAGLAKDEGMGLAHPTCSAKKASVRPSASVAAASLRRAPSSAAKP